MDEEERKERVRERARKRRGDNPERVHEIEHKSYMAHREERIKKTRKWQALHPVPRKARAKPVGKRGNNLKYKYGIDEQEYARLFEAQGGKCAICGRSPDKKPLFVDHDHITGKVRGLLCKACNFGIGFLGDNPEQLEHAARYLRQLSCRDPDEI